jgi:hypothetical protein
MINDKLPTQIRKTGFVLENEIAQQLKVANWTVISNRYYVDDAEESVREIDLVAYRASRIQHFDVYTTLLISCKKSELNTWALLSRDIDLKDPNYDWQPFHAWSNDKGLTYQLGKPETAKRYHSGIASLGVREPLRTPAVEVFAFQEMNKASGAPQNDKAIFNAITSLMKAQAYELGALPQRKRTPAIYQFNLVSIVDSDLIRLMFRGGDIDASPIDQEHYVARYIIKKRETFSRIRFLRADVFANLLPEYAALHRSNCKWFDAECNAFYEGIVEDFERAEILIDDLRKELRWPLRSAFLEWKLTAPELDNLNVYWSERDRRLHVFGSWGPAGTTALNTDEKVKEKVAAALLKIYRYSGAFDFEDDDIPF